MPQLVWSAAPDGTIDYYNERWVSYTGLTLADMQGDGVKGVVHPDELAETWRRWKDALANGKPYEMEYRLRHATDGSYRWFLGRAVPLFGPGKKILRWIGTATDIDEEKRATQRLRFASKASEMLFESSDLTRIFENIARLIVSEVADACVIGILEEQAFRIEAVAHRNPEMEPVLATMRGQRTLHPEAERAIVERIKKHTPYIRENLDLNELKSSVWPYLVPQIETLHPTSVLMVPLHLHATTYGALFVYYTDSKRTYRKDDFPIFVEMAYRTSLAIEHAKTLERERGIAATLQQALLPALLPKLDGLQFDTVYSPAGAEGGIGGDWYDAIELEDGSVVISVGDVTGRGLEAAVIMSKVRHAMGVVPRHEPDPARILDSADWFLGKRYPDAIVTAFVAVISPDRKMLRYANAGHPIPLLRRNRQLIELRATGLPLGLRRLAPLQQSQKIALQDEDLLALFTDGLIEWGENWNEGEKYLRGVLQSNVISITDRPAKLIQSVCGPDESHDDIAILTVSFRRCAQWTFRVENAQAAEHARCEFTEQLRRYAQNPALIGASELVFGELIGNVVRHAPGPVEIYLDWSGDFAKVHVIDTGPPFNTMGNLPKDILSECGRGLFIIREISPNLRVERIERYGNHVCATLPVRRQKEE